MKNLQKALITLSLLTNASANSQEILSKLNGEDNQTDRHESVTSFVATDISIPKLDKQAFKVVQQPYGNSGYVQLQKDTFTQFQLACKDISNGAFILFDTPDCYALLADNLLFPGSNLNELEIGDLIILHNFDNQVIKYKVSGIDIFQALSPNSVYSDFKLLGEIPSDNLFTTLDMTNLFYQNQYTQPKLVIQSCYEIDGELNGGRIFITALPINIEDE